MKLAQYMKKENLSDEALAKQLGLTRPTVSRWRRGMASPGRKAIIKVAQATAGKVAWKDWLAEETFQ